jgi:hypothetical protein
MKAWFDKFWRYYVSCQWEKRVLWTAAGLSLIPLAAASLVRPQPVPSEAPIEKSAGQVDTYIPKGFVLVPIEVQNYDALDSILGQFAVVDLLQNSNPRSPQPHLVARHVRILRAPKNPSHFAVLVEESAVAQVLKFGSQFTVIVRRPEKSGTEFVKDSPHRSIVYEGE